MAQPLAGLPNPLSLGKAQESWMDEHKPDLERDLLRGESLEHKALYVKERLWSKSWSCGSPGSQTLT